MYVQLGAEKTKALIGFYCFSACITVEKITRESKDTWTKSYLNSDLGVFKAFQLIPRHINIEIIHNLEIFAAKNAVKKHLKVTILQTYVGIYTWKTWRRKILRMRIQMWKGYTKVCNQPQPATTIHNHPQLPTTIHNHPQSPPTIHNHLQSPTVIHNHPKITQKSHNVLQAVIVNTETEVDFHSGMKQ